MEIYPGTGALPPTRRQYLSPKADFLLAYRAFEHRPSQNLKMLFIFADLVNLVLILLLPLPPCKNQSIVVGQVEEQDLSIR